MKNPVELYCRPDYLKFRPQETSMRDFLWSKMYIAPTVIIHRKLVFPKSPAFTVKGILKVLHSNRSFYIKRKVNKWLQMISS